MQMTSAVSTFGRKSEFDSFLCAPIGEEQNGMLLSVLSALARLDVDPWQEAATLTKMPPPDATLRLTSLLSSLPSDAATPLTPSAVVRLISLLPQKPPRDRWPRETSDGATTHTERSRSTSSRLSSSCSPSSMLEATTRQLRKKSPQRHSPARQDRRRRSKPIPSRVRDVLTPSDTGGGFGGDCLRARQT